MELSPGVRVAIPCRPCGGAMIPFSIQWGTHRLTCPVCGCGTLVRVLEEQGSARIQTEAAPET